MALRLWHIGFGLPEWYHPDEPIKAQKALAIAAGDLNPHYFWHPSFMLYATAAAVRAGQSFGWAATPAQAVLAGRVLNAVLGALTVPLTCLLARAAGGWAMAFAAAALLAVAPLAVFCSHYLKEDTPLTFWVVAAALAALRLARRGRNRDYLIAGALCGAAIASKYTGLLALVLPLVAHRQQPHPPARARWRLAAAAALAFVALTPFALADLWHFGRGVSHEAGNVVTGMATSAILPLPWLWTFHLRFSLLPGFGIVATALALLGFVALLRQASPAARLLTAFVGLGYLVFESSPYKPPPNFDRYVLPLLPFLAVLALVGVRVLRRRSAVLAGIALALALAEPAGRSVQLLAAIEPDTRERARAWLAKQLPADARVAVEGQLLTDLGEAVIAYAPRLSNARVSYTFSLASLADRLGEFDCVVASSFIYDRFVRYGAGEPAARQFYRELFTHTPAAEFAPAVRSYGFHNPTIRVYCLASPPGP
ncbi:MAG: glycosyltransferase family 39 protein [Deltaproteobacteria bacterium]|nr:glycosyltransferase family 39 protein [Deltaproteobacteria bacterium]